MNQIILADEQTIFRAGAARVLSLEDGMQIVAQCDECAELLIKIDRFKGAIIIASFTLPIDLEALFARIKSSGSRVILILGKGDILPYDLAGRVDGLIPREVSGTDFVSCVCQVSQGKRCILRSKIATLQANDSAGARACDRLTPREMQIVALIGQGYKNKLIAIQLNTKEQVIKNHLRSIYDKIGVSDRLELAIFTFRHRTLAEGVARAARLLKESAYQP